MVLKLYSFSTSPNVTRVALVLHEKRIPYEFVPVKYAAPDREHKTPEYLAKHPFGQVPYIDDDGFILYESWAIARYVCEKYRNQGPELLPTDLRKRALFEQAASIEVSNFNPYAETVVFEGLVKGFVYKMQPDQEQLDEASRALEIKLDVYEVILSKQKYLAGDELTLADLMHLGYGSLLSKAKFNAHKDTKKRPNVARWFNELESLSSWQAVKDGVSSYTPA